METYWLTVHGGGRWSCGPHSFEGGPHAVPEWLAQEARDQGYEWLRVTMSEDPPPKIEGTRLSGPLTLKDVLEGTPDVQERMGPVVQVTTATEQVADLIAPRNERGRIPCPHEGCEKDYAHEDGLQRHLEYKHSGETP